ncbi:adenylate/guanylate cyclase domain-containing protein [Parendozoicomonas haliclonae]|uniref:Adenylate cyclase 1 n=1 Tax=Parendozoicomonas haliclonae TaxID=1960125 RepID=A0A1X7AM79_9GAMM|nr:adenylate/guanylate cyclase domain-containing protein [Parendozoicomonas haliclonae]SMA49356.1 Adenylate cyclase 1 [Parendozoicomonas haliclonae]
MTVTSRIDNNKQKWNDRLFAFAQALPWITSGVVALLTLSYDNDLAIYLIAGISFLFIYPFLSQRLFARATYEQRNYRYQLALDSVILMTFLASLQPGLPASALIMAMLTLSGALTRFAWLAVGPTLLFAGWMLILAATALRPLQFESSLMATLAACAGLLSFLVINGVLLAREKSTLADGITNEKQLRKQQAWLTTTMARYLSPQVRELIYRGRSSMQRVENRKRRLTVFFSDIEGFTQLSDDLEPDQLARVLNHYLDEMSRIALKHGGTIDKFIGDSLMVFFGDPVSQGDKQDAKAAVAMALEMRRQLSVIRRYWRGQGIMHPLNIRMGISTGYCNVGNYGTRDRMDYTIVGRAVNLASRLEGLAESNQILITEETHSLIEDQIMCRRSNQIQVKGFHKPVQIYQVTDYRKNLGARCNWVEENIDGFSLMLDTARLDPIERTKAIKALNRAAQQLKEHSLSNTKSPATEEAARR